MALQPESTVGRPRVPSGLPLAARGLIDATDFLAFADRLRDLRERVDAVADHDNAPTWRRRLAAIADLARGDLERADLQLSRLSAEVRRTGA